MKESHLLLAIILLKIALYIVSEVLRTNIISYLFMAGFGKTGCLKHILPKKKKKSLCVRI